MVAGPNVLSGKTYLFARDSVGTSGAELRTQVSAIEGVAETGGFFVANAGELTVGGVVPGIAPAITARGTIRVGSNNRVTVGENVTADTIEILSNEGGHDDSVTIRAGVTLETSADIVIRADVNGVGSFAWNRWPELIERGYQAAERQRNALLRYRVSEEEWEAWLASRAQRRRMR